MGKILPFKIEMEGGGRERERAREQEREKRKREERVGGRERERERERDGSIIPQVVQSLTLSRQRSTLDITVDTRAERVSMAGRGAKPLLSAACTLLGQVVVPKTLSVSFPTLFALAVAPLVETQSACALLSGFTNYHEVRSLAKDSLPGA